MFASKNLFMHLTRGAVGFGLIFLAFTTAQVWLTIPLFLGGLVALRGCPMCWTIGLIETIYNKVQQSQGKVEVVLCTTCSEATYQKV